MYQVGLSSCGFSLTEDNFKRLAESGIAAIEISMPSDQYAQINYREILEFSKRYQVGLWSYHLPFSPFRVIDISSPSKEIREHSVELYTELIGKATDIGIDKFIVHPSGEPIEESARAERMKHSIETLDRLAEIAHRHGAIVAVEDLPRSCLGRTAAEIRELISANDKLRVCFDTNHLLVDTNLNFMTQLSDKIVTVHVSDYDFVDEKHWLPGEGSVDWSELLATLRAINYRGPFLYEISLKPLKTLPRSRDLTFADFARNADEIFKGKPLTRIC